MPHTHKKLRFVYDRIRVHVVLLTQGVANFFQYLTANLSHFTAKRHRKMPHLGLVLVEYDTNRSIAILATILAK